ncbi:hypothetical protein Acid345_3879 [Candidatus Koribacter versatilis Ellin345]|uniref:Uncharacterized protein n=2 Tax=Candidatus Korobacter versatilis TaxID=658062 RepID=Q1IJS1_KORVE|nr:hypothetical protein Acid345_3879 [Candidatus Koribacter versatilis Ellin345]
MIIAGLFAVPLALIHVPLSAFGMMLVGWIATALILGLALAYLLIGFGLLRLKRAAWVAAIALLVLFAVNAIVDASIPGTHAKMLEAMKSTPLFSQQANRPAPPEMPLALKLLPISLLAIPLWFLIRRREAFE